MQVRGHVERLGRLPEGIVIVAGKWQVLGWNLPDQRADQAGFLTTFELFDGVLDVIKRNHRNADQTTWRGFTVIDQPVVGDLKTGFLHFGIFERKETKTERWV